LVGSGLHTKSTRPWDSVAVKVTSLSSVAVVLVNNALPTSPILVQTKTTGLRNSKWYLDGSNGLRFSCKACTVPGMLGVPGVVMVGVVKRWQWQKFRRGVSGAYKSSVRRSDRLHFTRSNFSSLRVVMDYIQLVFCDCMYRFSMYPVCVQNSEEKTVHTYV
jgi:hypothetical protein